MIFTIPTFSRYITGLAILLALSIMLFLAQDSINLQKINPMTGIVIALVFGHLIGCVTQPGGPAQGRPTRAAAEPIVRKTKTLYVGNIAYSANRRDLENLFSQFGAVNSVRIMTDKQTRKSRGYGFIEMNSNDAKEAVKHLNGFDFKGRSLKVNEANDRE